MRVLKSKTRSAIIYNLGFVWSTKSVLTMQTVKRSTCKNSSIKMEYFSSLTDCSKNNGVDWGKIHYLCASNVFMQCQGFCYSCVTTYFLRWFKEEI
mgnify:CR=1 FL=1